MLPGRPRPDEHDPYYTGYIDQAPGEDIVGLLRGQLDETAEMFAAVDDAQGNYRYETGKWSVKELLGHLIDGERVFAYRALCIARGESTSLPGMDQDDYVREAGFDSRSVASLAEEYRHVRRSTIALLESLDEETWLRAGVANDAAISVRALAFIIGGHQVHHMKVLRERYLTS